MRMLSMSACASRDELGFSWAALLNLAWFTPVLGSAVGLIYAECSWDKDAHSAALASPSSKASSGMSLWPWQHRQKSHSPSHRGHLLKPPSRMRANASTWLRPSPGVEPVALPMGQSSPQLQGSKNVGRGEELPLTPSVSPGVISQTQFVHQARDHSPLTYLVGVWIREVSGQML